MEFGMFHQFPVVPGQSQPDAFEQAFDQIDAAERYGLDAMWLAELHVDPARSVLASPMTIASAIAARTSRIKIGIAVQVLPLWHPLRIAEEAATVDQISDGRLIFGVGRSGLPRTYEAYGIPYAESRDRFARPWRSSSVPGRSRASRSRANTTASTMSRSGPNPGKSRCRRSGWRPAAPTPSRRSAASATRSS
jgi:hypothetical protein